MNAGESRCPGCRLPMPRGTTTYDGSFHASPECWSVFCEVLQAEFGNAVLFAQVHQLSVDAYAVQHAGGKHADKSVCIHLAGLHLALDRGHAPVRVPPLLQQLAGAVEAWPHLPPPEDRGALTAFDVATAGSAEEHASRARAWAEQVWRAWTPHHAAVTDLVARHLERRA